MLDKFVEDWKKEADEFVAKLGAKYEDLAELILEDLSERKVEITAEINKLNEVISERKGNADKLEKEIDLGITALEEGRKEIGEQTVESDRLSGEIVKKKDVLNDIDKREKAVVEKENELEEKDLEVRARQMDIDEKQRSIRRVLDKAKQI